MNFTLRVVFLIILVFISTIYSQDQHLHSHLPDQGRNFDSDSSVDSEETKQKIEHDEEGLEDMSAMVASLKGDFYTSVAESKSSDPSKEAWRNTWHVKLDQSNRYGLSWMTDYPSNEIMFTLSINHTSSRFQQGSDIFALGFSEYGELTSSDFCIIWYDLSHKLHLQDARTDALSKLQLIDSTRSQCKLVKSMQDPLEGRVSEEHIDSDNNIGDDDTRYEYPKVHRSLKPADTIEISFRRPLDVCKAEGGMNYYRIDNGTTHLLWFTLKGPLLSIDGLNLAKLQSSGEISPASRANKKEEHKPSEVGGQFEYGMRRLQLIASGSQEPKAASTNSLDIKMERFEIPAKDTTYWCKLFKLPRKFESRRYHMTKYEAVIERGNEHVVHHMELFSCANLDTDQEQALHDLYEGKGWSGDCDGSDRPISTKPCRRVVLAWAMGAHPLVYPEQVGQSIGGHGYSPYVVLEVHYNNVASSSGLIDNSGLRFYYTSKLRPYDAGVLEVGLEYTNKISIPPNMVTPIAGHCVSECTRVAMSSSSSSGKSHSLKHGSRANLEDGIYIFAGQMHTHLTGVASWTEIVREGKLVSELQRDNHYSPHFQEIRLLPEPVHVAPGDALIHYCLYDTRKRANITLGGFATSDEMCVTYLHYYPRIDLEVCKSSVDTSALENYFAYLKREENQRTSETLVELHPDSPKAKSVEENYHSIEWTARRSKELIQFYANAPMSVQCNRSNSDRWPGYWNGIGPTRLWSDISQVEPFETRLPKGEQLIFYRGRGFGDRHSQCRVPASEDASSSQLTNLPNT